MRHDAQTFSDWSPLVADCAARIYGIQSLDDRHWRAITAVREEFLRSGSALDLPTVCSICGILSDELASLFPNSHITLYALAGVPAPRAMDETDPSLAVASAEHSTNNVNPE